MVDPELRAGALLPQYALRLLVKLSRHAIGEFPNKLDYALCFEITSSISYTPPHKSFSGIGVQADALQAIWKSLCLRWPKFSVNENSARIAKLFLARS